MKKYIVVIGIILIPMSLFGNSNQVKGPLNDLTNALRFLQQKISGVQSAPAWVQQLQALEQQIDQIQQSGAAGCSQTQSLYTLSANYTKLINDNGAIAQYKQAYNKYALLPYIFEMDCKLVDIKNLMSSNQNVTLLLQDYEATYGSYSKTLSALRVLPDQKYANELKAVRSYVNQYKPTVTPPPSTSTGTSSTQGTTPPPPPPPMPTGPTKIPTSSQSGSQPAPTTTEPTAGRSILSFLGQIASGIGVLKKSESSTQSKPSQQLSEKEKAVLERRRAIEEEEIGEEEAREEAQRIAEDIRKDEQRKKFEEEKRIEQERKKREAQSQQKPPTAEELERRKKFEEAARAAEEEDEAWEEEDFSAQEEAKKAIEREKQVSKDQLDNTTKNKFALTQNKTEMDSINKQRREKGLAELPGAYSSREEQQQMRDSYDKDSRRNYLVNPRFETEGIVAVRNSIDSDRKKYGFEELGLQYPQQFEDFKKKYQLSGKHPFQDLHDDTVLRFFISKDVYKNRPGKLEEALKYINEERSKHRLPILR